MNTDLLSTLQSVQAALANGQPLDPLGAYLHEGRILTVPTKRGPASFHLRDLDTIMRSVRGNVAKLQPAPVLPSPVPVAKLATKPDALQLRDLVPSVRGLVDQVQPAPGLPSPVPVAKVATKPDALQLRDLIPSVRGLVDQVQPAPVLPTPVPVAKLAAKPARKPASKPEPLPTWSAHRIPLGCAPKRAVGNFSTREQRARTLADLRHNLAEAERSGCEPLVRVMRAALQVATKRGVDQKPNLI